MAKKKSAGKRKTDGFEPDPVKFAQLDLLSGALGGLMDSVQVHRDNSYPMAKADWAYVTSDGNIYLNPRREAGMKEWVYILAHCLLHLGLGHIQEERGQDRVWLTACDLVAARFLAENRIGSPPAGLDRAIPLPAKSEEQAYEQLLSQEDYTACLGFGTMSGGRPDMVWNGPPMRDAWSRKPGTPFPEIFARSLQEAMEESLRKACEIPPEDARPTWRMPVWRRAREWFLSSYPLLGAVASAFRLVDDKDIAVRMHIPVAAVSSELGEIYINPDSRLDLEEWKFVLAHEFLHAALRHGERCEERDPVLWNAACDFVINGWLTEMDVGVMPEGALLDGRFKGLSAEAVYDLIWEDIRRYTGPSAPKDILYGNGDGRDALTGQELDDLYRSALQRGLAYHQEQGRGTVPSGLVEEIHALSRPPIRWDVELAKWFDKQFTLPEKRRTYARLSRRQASTPDIPRPAWRQEDQQKEQRTFAVLLDTSGSMDRALLAAALGSIASYSQAREVTQVRVVFCDAAAYDQGLMRPEEIAGAVKVRGRGGTVLQPGIDLLDGDKAFPRNAPLLIITDGACDRLRIAGREHAYLIPKGRRLPFAPKGPVFKLI